MPPKRSTIWALLILVVCAETALVKAFSSLTTLDALPYYGPARALALIQNLDEHARAVYRTLNLADFAFIALYSLLNVNWLRYLRYRLQGTALLLPLLGLLPGFFDFVESLGVALLLRSQAPSHSPGLWLAVAGTPLKWLALIFVASLLMRGEILCWRNRNAAPEPRC